MWLKEIKVNSKYTEDIEKYSGLTVLITNKMDWSSFCTSYNYIGNVKYQYMFNRKYTFNFTNDIATIYLKNVYFICG